MSGCCADERVHVTRTLAPCRSKLIGCAGSPSANTPTRFAIVSTRARHWTCCAIATDAIKSDPAQVSPKSNFIKQFLTHMP
jgi:hypothetical protein